jgi:D-alanyl-D-alanine carboxypeptidase
LIRVARTLVAATTTWAVIAVPTAAAAAQDDTHDLGLQSRLDDVVAVGAVGALAEVHDGHRVWRGTSGIAELDASRAVPVRGRFRTGSITKTFVATVVLQLVDEGSLRLDDPVGRWLPGVVPGGDSIAVRQLLDQTSGLPDVVPTLPKPPEPAFYDNRWRTWSAGELIERALEQPATFEPGDAFHYSSTNYLLLGQVIEAVTDRSYAAEIERRIIQPLKLSQTTLPGTSPWIRGPHPHGYVPGPDHELLDYTIMNPSMFGAAG